MRTNYAACLERVLYWEGGKSNDPNDPGGRTNMGIIQRVYDAYRERKGWPLQSVYKIANSERDEIYAFQYWDPIRGNILPPGIDLFTFDSAVNSGPVRGAIWLQQSLGDLYTGKVDGMIGNITLSALNKCELVPTINRAFAIRLAFLKRLKTWQYFGKGWGRRVVGQNDVAIKMATGEYK